MHFRYKGYYYWYSMVDACYYKQKVESFNKIEISKEEFYNTVDEFWEAKSID